MLAAGCGLPTALHAVELAEIHFGDTVVVQGSGPVGLNAAILAQLRGAGKVTLDGRETSVHAGEIVDVPVGAAHRIENPAGERLVFIEIQRGGYLGEDDIVRLQDDFGRATV